MLHLRNRETVLYSLVSSPNRAPNGTWVEVRDGQVFCGPDDPTRPAEDVLRTMPAVDPRTCARFEKDLRDRLSRQQDPDRARDVTAAGLEGHTSDTMDGSILRTCVAGPARRFADPFAERLRFSGLAAHRAVLGGDAVWVHNRQPVNFRETWLDKRANMIRLPGIVACCTNPQTLDTLCTLARDWNPNRYTELKAGRSLPTEARLALPGARAKTVPGLCIGSWTASSGTSKSSDCSRPSTRSANRVAMHAVRGRLVDGRRPSAAGLPLLAGLAPLALLERRLRSADAGSCRTSAAGRRHAYRVRRSVPGGHPRLPGAKLAGTGIDPLFPIWTTPQKRAARRQMMAADLRAVLTCVDPKQLDPRSSDAVRRRAILADLPADVDPCGERGEFHTFCWAGPMFAQPISGWCRRIG